MRIAFIVDAWFPFVGGGQIYAKELKKQLEQDYSYQIDVYAPQSAHILYRLFWSFLIVPVIIFQHLLSPYSILHSQGYNSGLTGKIVSLLTGVNIVHTVHGSNLLDLKKESLKTRLEKWLLTQIKYDAQISVSHSFLQHPNINKPLVIPNAARRQFINIKHLYNKTAKKLLWIGRDDWVKGADIFETAMSLVRQIIPEIEVNMIVGGTFTAQELAQKIDEADIFVQSSRSEGFSFSVIEAMSVGLPVVVTDVGENARIVESGKTGYVVEPEKPELLAEKIIYLLQHSKQIEEIGKAGRKRIIRDYSWEQVASKTNDVYKNVLGMHE